MQKEKRQQAVLDLIKSKKIAKQEELLKLLAAQNFAVNQSSVSRDLVELGVIKVNGFYALPQNGERRGLSLQSLTAAGDSLLIGKCELGLASALTVQIDRAEIAEIVGTIAGEDTIFIAVENKKAQKTAARKIWKVFDK